jgi:protein-disulfide isomerase
MSEEKKESLFDKLVPVLLLASIVLAFVVGVLWQKVSLIEKSDSPTVVKNQQVEANDNAAPSPNSKLTSDQAKKVPVVTDTDHIKGNKNAKVVVIEYSDYECPYCSQFHPTMEKIVKEYGNKVAWVFRQFPLYQIHPKAKPAAIAAECVAEIGGNDAFWKFTEAVYAKQSTALADITATAVSSAGVNEAKFKDCFDNEKTVSKVDAQNNAGLEAGITGTPGSFLVNQKGEIWLVSGALPYESFKSAIETALK